MNTQKFCTWTLHQHLPAIQVFNVYKVLASRADRFLMYSTLRDARENFYLERYEGKITLRGIAKANPRSVSVFVCFSKHSNVVQDQH